MFEKIVTGIVLHDNGEITALTLTAGPRAMSITGGGFFEGEGEDLAGKWASAFEKAKAADLYLENVVLGIPSSLVFKKTIEFPFSGRRKISQVLGSVLDGELPVAPEDVVVDYLSIDSSKEGSTGIAVACKKDTLHDVIGIFPESSKLLSIQTDAVGLLSAGLFSGVSNGAVVMCATGYAVGVAIRNSKPAGLKRISLGDENDAKKVASLGRDLMDEGGSILLACGPFLEPVMADLQDDGYAKIFTSVDLDIFREMQVTLHGDPGRYLPALGLALKGLGRREAQVFDLQQGPFRKQSVLADIKIPMVRTGVILLAVIMLAAGSYIAEYRSAKSEYEKIKQQMRSSFTELFPGINVKYEVPQIREELNKLERRSGDLAVFRSPGALAVLGQLSRSVPAEVGLQIVEFSFDSERLRFDGTVSSFDAVDRIRDALEAADIFSNVKVQNARVAADASKVSFRLQMEVL